MHNLHFAADICINVRPAFDRMEGEASQALVISPAIPLYHLKNVAAAANCHHH